jgi:tetratricopeptide (TPR) repeat protein
MVGTNRTRHTGQQTSALLTITDAPCGPNAAECPREQPLEASNLLHLHGLLVSAQMAGDGQAAIAAAETLSQLAAREPLRGRLLAQRFTAAQYFVHLQFSTPQTVLTIPAPSEDLPYAVAMWHYARGAARATTGDTAGAQQDVEAIALIQLNASFTTLTAGAAATKDAVRTGRHVLQARIAQARGNVSAATVELERAAAIEDALPATQPPYWYFPVRQSLGAALLRAGQLDRAEQAFRACLDRNPDNGWALFGLAEVYQQRGYTDQAEATRARLAKVWVGNRGQLALARL